MSWEPKLLGPMPTPRRISNAHPITDDVAGAALKTLAANNRRQSQRVVMTAY